ncbi:hypothetical protein CSC12_5585 [Klebsiella michiganensis]|nr:hypothetical protein CSC12_5585 [Klebsiella michiganensis]
MLFPFAGLLTETDFIYSRTKAVIGLLLVWLVMSFGMMTLQL